MVKRAIIFANGVMSNWPVHFSLNTEKDIIIAADGGADLCHQWDVLPHVLIGDLDSISPALLAPYEAEQVNIIRHPSRKDETDLELALRHAHQNGVDQIDILGALGRRWDMTLSNIMLLTAPFLRDIRIRIIGDREILFLLHEKATATLRGQVGDGLSLIPLSHVKGVTLTGSAYLLDNDTILAGSTWGLSNLFSSDVVNIKIISGLLLVIHTISK